MLSKGEDILPLVGARRVTQLQESMKSLEVKLSNHDIKSIEEAIPEHAIVVGSFLEIHFKNGVIAH